MSASVLSLTFSKCSHMTEDKCVIATVVNCRMFIDIFNEYLNFGLKNNTFKVTSQAHVISPTLTVGEVVSLFNVRQFVFTYEGGPQAEEETLSSRIRSAADKADVQAVNAFQIVMAGGRIFPPKKNKQVVYFKRNADIKTSFKVGCTITYSINVVCPKILSISIYFFFFLYPLLETHFY